MEPFDSLLAALEQIPAIDISSQIDPDAPAARSGAEVVLEPQVRLELETARAPSEALEAENPRKRLAGILPHLEKIRNTATAWCLNRIVSDLYELPGKPHEVGADALWEQVEQRSEDASWPGSVLGRANVEKVLVNCDWDRPLPRAAERFAPLLRLDTLINLPHAQRNLDSLGEISGHPVYEAADLKKSIDELFARAVEAGAVGASAAFNPQADFTEGSRQAADRILSLVLLGQKVDRDDRRSLRSFVMDTVLAACREQRLPFQLAIGERRGCAGGKTLSGYDPGLMPMYSELFHRHDGVRFDVIVSNALLSSELNRVCRAYRNVCSSGAGLLTAFPTPLRGMLRERLEMLPVDKVNALATDGRCVEWVYGRTLLLRRALAAALAETVSEGYCTEQEALDTARMWLHDNPARIYHLK